MTSNPIVIPDNQSYDVDQFNLPAHIDKSDISSILIPGGMIRDRTKVLAQEIHDVYAGQDIYLLCVLKGAHQFFSDLMHFMQDCMVAGDKPFEYDFIPARSYEGTKSTCELSIGSLKDPGVLKGKHVILVEDIVDTANAMAGKDYVVGQTPTGGLIGHLLQYEPLDVIVASMTLKRNPTSNGYQPRFVCFSVPDLFLVGYGLDVDQKLREIGHLCVLSEKGKMKYAKKSVTA